MFNSRLVGQNLYWSNASNVPAEHPTTLWVDWEKPHYDLDTNECARNKVCGHYTQVCQIHSLFSVN